MASSEPEYARWEQALDLAASTPSALTEQPCPHCGQRELNLLYLVEDDASVSATIVFWCDACLRGLQPLRSQIPDEGRIVKRGEAQIPRFQIIYNRPS